MPNPPVADSTRSVESWNEVRARDRVVRYRRSGAGRAVLVLRAPDDPESIWPELLDALGSCFRLIVPEPPAAGSDSAAWLSAFVEGLGMPGLGVVAADCFCIAALELVLLESDQIARLVLVANAGANDAPDAGRGELSLPRRGGNVSVLLVRRGQSADEVLSLVQSFLAETTPAPS